MVGWHHRLNGYEFELTLGDSEGQVSLVCCNQWGCKESDTTERLNDSNSVRERSVNIRAFPLNPGPGPRMKS